MSRTNNTAPWRIQEGRAPGWRSHGYPGALGGAWRGIKAYRKQRERTARARMRDALSHGTEPEPTRHRGSARYDLW
jgi:hypothetical protein